MKVREAKAAIEESEAEKVMQVSFFARGDREGVPSVMRSEPLVNTLQLLYALLWMIRPTKILIQGFASKLSPPS